MSWTHSTYGWEKYENFVSALAAVGVAYEEGFTDQSYVRGSDRNCECYYAYSAEPVSCPHCQGTCGCRQQLRLARFAAPDGTLKVVEEYLAIDDRNCDGESQINIAVYKEGERPDLKTEVFYH